jgi:hypothetical protein
MKAIGPQTAAGVFDTHEDAERAVDALRHAGFRDGQIGLVTRGDVISSEAGQGAVTGAVGGAAAGMLAGLAAAAGLLSPIGPVIAGGALAGLLATTAAGAALGGVAGLLGRMGFPEEHARYYESELAGGRTLVTVNAAGRFDEATAVLRRCGARDPHDRPPLDAPPIPVL